MSPDGFWAGVGVIGSHGKDRRQLSTAGAALTLFALVVRLWFVAFMPSGAVPVPMPALGLLDGVTICHSGDDAGGNTPNPAPSHQDHERGCAVCPTCLTFASPLIGAEGQPALREVIALAPIRFAMPPSLAPPGVHFAAAKPRGPPISA